MFAGRFQPTVWATVAMLLAVTLFSTLAWWQWQRAQFKSALQERFEQSRSLPPLTLGSARLALHRFRPALVSGSYRAQQTILVDNVVHQGQAGYGVITPLLLEDGTAVAVDRGWLPVGLSRSVLPSLETPKGVVDIVGSIDRPSSKPFGLGAELLQQSIDSRVWPWFEIETLAVRSGLQMKPFVLTLDVGEIGAMSVVRSSRFDAKVGMHIGYAVHWALFALIVIALFFWHGWHEAKSTGEKIADDGK